jgi:hypothetical protein
VALTFETVIEGEGFLAFDTLFELVLPLFEALAPARFDDELRGGALRCFFQASSHNSLFFQLTEPQPTRLAAGALELSSNLGDGRGQAAAV